MITKISTIALLGLLIFSITDVIADELKEEQVAQPLFPFGGMFGHELPVSEGKGGFVNADYRGFANADISAKEALKTIHRSGPRVGMTGLTGELADELKEKHDAEPLFSQFGWMFEQELPAGQEKRISVIFQEFFLVGGLDQNLAVPGFTFLMGLRVAPGIEFGAGPNIFFDLSELKEDKPKAGSFVKTAFVLGIGMSLPVGRFNFPINIAVTPASTGLRTTIITGVSW